MKIGIKIPQLAPAPESELRQFVQAIDALGYDSLWVGDHFVIPANINNDKYPYLWRFSSETNDLFPEKYFLDALTTLAWVAGISERLSIGVGVLVVPMRNPVELAKELATLDLLCGGRLIAGVGAGWLEEEFDALGRQYRTRGKALVEGVEAMRTLWNEAPASYQGETVSFDSVYCLPSPVQAGGPPIWLGGDSRVALQRAARWGDGWQPVELTPEDFLARSEQLDLLIHAEGRPTAAVTRSVSTRLRLSAGNETQTLDTIGRYRDAGCEHLVIYSTPSRSVHENVDRAGTLMELYNSALPGGRRG